MSTLSDAKFDALRAQGFTGAMSDMTLQWLQFNGATSPCVSDAWHEMLSLLTISIGQNNDRWYLYLKMNSFDTNGAQLNDMEKLFWEGGGTITAPVDPSGFGPGYGLGYL